MDEVAEGILQVLLALEGRKNLTPVLHIPFYQAFPLPRLPLQLQLCLLHRLPADVSLLPDLGAELARTFHLELILLSVHLLNDVHEVEVLRLGWRLVAVG